MLHAHVIGRALREGVLRGAYPSAKKAAELAQVKGFGHVVQEEEPKKAAKLHTDLYHQSPPVAHLPKISPGFTHRIRAAIRNFDSGGSNFFGNSASIEENGRVFLSHRKDQQRRILRAAGALFPAPNRAEADIEEESKIPLADAQIFANLYDFLWRNILRRGEPCNAQIVSLTGPVIPDVFQGFLQI